MNSNIFDIIAIVVIAFFAFNGLRKGLVAEVFKILGVLLGIILAIQYIDEGASLVHSIFATNADVEKVLGFILIFVVVMFVSTLLAKFVHRILKLVLLGWLDKSGGVLFGGLKGALIVSAILPLFAFLPDEVAFVKDVRENSYAYAHLQGFAPKVYDYIFKVVPGSESFTDKLKDAFPMAGGLPGMGEGSGLSPDEFKQFMGMEEGDMLKEANKILGGSSQDEQTLKDLQKMIGSGNKKK